MSIFLSSDQQTNRRLMAMRAKLPENITLLAILLVSLGQLGISIYTPSLPPMAKALNATPGEVANTLMTYLLTFGLGQLVLGPISERTGRRPILIASLVVFIVSSFVGAQADTALELSLARLCQGFGAGGASAIARIMLRDTHTQPQLQMALARVSMGIVLVPLLAPILGGYIEVFAGWRHQFTATAVAAVFVLFFMVPMIAESTKAASRKRFRLSQIPQSYAHLLRNRSFLLPCAIAAGVYGCTTVYYLSAPFIFQNTFGLAPDVYGWLPIPTVLGYIVGSWWSIRLGRDGRGHVCIPLGLMMMLCGSVAMTVTSQLDASPALIVIPMCIVMVGEGLALPAAIAQALSLPSVAPGYAAAGLGAFQMVGSGMVTAAITTLPEPNHLMLSLGLLCLTLICVGCHTALQRKRYAT